MITVDTDTPLLIYLWSSIENRRCKLLISRVINPLFTLGQLWMLTDISRMSVATKQKFVW